MILIGLGANLPSGRFGPPRATLSAALDMLETSGIRVAERSSWYESAPVPASDQPWFVNAVARLDSRCAPCVLLRHLHDVEVVLGRVRGETPNLPRAADLDLLDYNGWVTDANEWPWLPHPRLQARAFVVLPLAEVAPRWHHPVTGQSITELAQQLPTDQACVRMPDVPAAGSDGRAS